MDICSGEQVPLESNRFLGHPPWDFEVVIIKQSGITWMPDESLEPLVKELDDTADPWRWGLGMFSGGSHHDQNCHDH